MSESEVREDQVPEEESERGTAVLALLFLAALCGMWAVVYFIMLDRGL